MSDDDDYRLRAKAYWDLNAERLKFVSQIQADYGKWLVVTISSINLAAIYLVTQPVIPEVVRKDPASYWPFIIGICAILLCGFSLWANYTFAQALYGKWMDPGMLTHRSEWPKGAGGTFNFFMQVSFYLPLVFGIASAGCIPWGAYEVFYRQHPAIVQTPQPNTSPAPPKPQPQPQPKARTNLEAK